MYKLEVCNTLHKKIFSLAKGGRLEIVAFDDDAVYLYNA